MLAFLPHDERLKGLFLLPTCGTKFYRFDGAWKKLYSEDFTVDEKKAIIAALDHAVRQAGYTAEKHWGEPIEDRNSQIMFSALGQSASLDEKEKWDPDFAKHKAIKAILAPFPAFSIQLGGSTSIDVTRPRIDKAYGVRELRETLGIAIADMIFVGDAICSGGNDYPAKQAAAEFIRVRATRMKRSASSKRSALASRPAVVIARAPAKENRALYPRPPNFRLRAIPPKNRHGEARRRDRCIYAEGSR